MLFIALWCYNQKGLCSGSEEGARLCRCRIALLVVNRTAAYITVGIAFPAPVIEIHFHVFQVADAFQNDFLGIVY